MIQPGTSIAGNLVIAFSLLTGQVDPQYRNAADTSFRAVLEYPELKSDINLVQTVGEKTFWKYSPLTQQQLVYALYLGPLITGEISTKPFPGLKYTSTGGFTLRPEIGYNLRDSGSLNSTLWLTKEF